MFTYTLETGEKSYVLREGQLDEVLCPVCFKGYGESFRVCNSCNVYTHRTCSSSVAWDRHVWRCRICDERD